METLRMALGRRGEEAACGFLRERGQEIIERNCRRGHLETDIITVDGEGIHFVEVKSRTAPVTAAPQENVTPAKQKRLAAAALRYLNASKDERLARDMEVIFDVVSIVFEGGKTEIEYFPRAFVPIYV